MPKAPYNPQEVLSPLMSRFGRTLPGERDETFEQMVQSVSEQLDVDHTHAAQLLEKLESAGLLRYEGPSPVEHEPFVTWTGEPVDEQLTEGAQAPAPAGAWHIGPKV